MPGLNAQYLSGLSGQQLATGGDGFTAEGTATPINPSEQVIARTGLLDAGTYYVTATALLGLAAGDFEGLCEIRKDSGGPPIALGGGTTSPSGGLVQAVATAAVSVTAGDTLQWVCWAEGANGSNAYNAGITAIRLLSSTGTAPATTGHSKAALPGGQAPQVR